MSPAFETPVVISDWANRSAIRAFLVGHLVGMPVFYIAALLASSATLPNIWPAMAVVAGLAILQAILAISTWRLLQALRQVSLKLDGSGLELRSGSDVVVVSWQDLTSWRQAWMKHNSSNSLVLEAVSTSGQTIRFPGSISGFGKAAGYDELVERLADRAGHLQSS